MFLELVRAEENGLRRRKHPGGGPRIFRRPSCDSRLTRIPSSRRWVQHAEVHPATTRHPGWSKACITTSLSIRTSMAAVKTGELPLGPISMEPVVRVPRPQTRGQRRFGTPFDDDHLSRSVRHVRRRVYHQTGEDAQRPRKDRGQAAAAWSAGGFLGGHRTVQAGGRSPGQPAKAQAGDPITLHALLRGQGNFDRIQPPVLADENGLQTYPATSKFKAEDEVKFRGLKTFEQVVIPRSARNALPGYRFVVPRSRRPASTTPWRRRPCR